MPAFFEKVIPAVADETAAVAIVSPVFKGSTRMGQARTFVDAFGVREFVAEAANYGYHRAADVARAAVPAGPHHSVRSIARSHGLTVLAPEDVNAPAFLERLRALEPDLVVSVSCPQIFREDLLALPPLGCINVHGALLPHHRGMLPTFWALARQEEHTGVTVHYMDAGIDGGRIIHQRTVPIGPDDTLRSLMKKSKRVAADAVLEVIDRFREGAVDAAPNPPGEGSYNSFPTREDVRRFKSLGRRLR
jgi:methionyl-tRNA formyltransferase